MLDANQVAYFRTFGFVRLPRLLSVDLAAALRREVDAALRDAYAATYDERVIDGISGHYLPMASELTPCSSSLVCDNPLLIEAARQLLAAPVVPSVPEGVLYFSEAGWHNDDGIGVRGVKFATYFEPLDAENGGLRFAPCSHQLDERSCLHTAQPACDPDCPGVVVATQPGDVIAFDLHTFHASFGGRDRLAWHVEYLALPQNEQEEDKVRRWMADSFDQAGRGFDRDRYPVWRDWIRNPRHHARRCALIERMQTLGITSLPGADTGIVLNS